MPKIEKLTWNSIDSDTLGVFISGAGVFDAPELDVTAYEIPGRNGDLLIPNNRYKNIEVTYPCFVPDSFETRAQSIRNWLRSSNSYQKLTDTYDTTHYRVGIPTGILTFEPVGSNRGANFQIVFNCKPQRYLNSGDGNQSITNNMTLTNPTQYNSLPVFYMVSGWSSGATFSVTNSLGTFTMTATAAYSYSAYISCENKNIYRQVGNVVTNLNDKMSGDFPILTPGTNTITISGFAQPWIRPRWYEL